jgi:hypothetical protein
MFSFKTQIDDTWNELIGIIDQYFEGELKDNIMRLHDHFGDRMKVAPASGRPNFHNCFKGGYIDHVVRVIKSSLEMKKMFVNMGVKVNHSDSDVVLASMFHDLGKIGNMDESYYVYQTDEWRRNKLNEWYTHNTNLELGSVTDRSVWLLNEFDIKISVEVFKAIKLSDGMFTPGNEREYRKSTDSKNILHYIVHFADWSATVAEKQHYLQSLDADEVEDDTILDESKIKDMKNAFDKLFEEA